MAADAREGKLAPVEAARPPRVTSLAAQLQQALINAAFAELGIVGPSRFDTWCKGLGRFGMSSIEVKELFGMLDSVERTGEVSPDAFADVNMSRKLFTDSLRHSLDLICLIQLKYRLMVFACRQKLGIEEAAELQPADLCELCRSLHVIISEEEARSFQVELLLLGGQLAEGINETMREENGACQRSLLVGPMCNVLAIWGISATKLHSKSLLSTARSHAEEHLFLGTRRTLPSTLAPHSCIAERDPPAAYVGKTPIEIVVRYKDPATFPWHKLPEAACGQRFEELYRLSVHHRLQPAIDAVHLLTAEEYDRTSQHR